jgi:hypothetical protein
LTLYPFNYTVFQHEQNYGDDNQNERERDLKFGLEAWPAPIQKLTQRSMTTIGVVKKVCAITIAAAENLKPYILA